MMSFDKTADKLLDIFSDIRFSDDDLIYVARSCVLRAEHIVILDRMMLLTENIKGQLDFLIGANYEQDTLF